MGLLDGDLAAVFASAFDGFYLDATLHKANLDDDGQGGGSVARSDYPAKAQLDSTTDRQQNSEGYVDTDQRIFVLASGLAMEPTTDDEITVDGRRWMIASVATDPAGAYYELRGRLSPVEAS
jgi:hypothetical protein